MMPKPTLILLLLLAAPLGATSLVPADLGELSHEALAIVRGRVAAVDARRTDDRRTIETLVTLDVERYLKGDLGSTVQFRVPGGRLGRYRSVFVGAPDFAVDDRVVVFLGASGPTIPHLVGFSQGVYRLVLAGGAGWMVTPPAMWPSPDANQAVVRGAASRTPIALGDFESRVRTLAGAK
ncbi:MAG TPA: hypothetical protein VFA27_02080 [Vicinamibacterales bacterium]|nr:hypothetical protein [Vicinamibacterales bacterium]